MLRQAANINIHIMHITASYIYKKGQKQFSKSRKILTIHYTQSREKKEKPERRKPGRLASLAPTVNAHTGGLFREADGFGIYSAL